MSKNKSLFLKSIFVVFILLFASANVFAYTTKNTDAGLKNREEALSKKPEGITNIEIEDVSIKLDRYNGCTVTIKLKEGIPYTKEPTSSPVGYYPNFLISLPLKDKTYYPKYMSNYVNADHTDRSSKYDCTDDSLYYHYKDGVAHSFLIRMKSFSDLFYIKLPQNIADSLCRNRGDNAKLDVFVFVSTKSGLGLKNSVFFNYNLINSNKSDYRHEDLKKSKDRLYKVGLSGNLNKSKDNSGKYKITYFYNLDYAYDVLINTDEAIPCKILNTKYGDKGYKYIKYSGNWFEKELYGGIDSSYVCISCDPLRPGYIKVTNPFNEDVYQHIHWDTFYKEKSKYPDYLIDDFKDKLGCFDDTKESTTPTAPTNLSCDKCPGYKKSQYYPNRTKDGVKYNPGSLCYKCNDSRTATACKPDTGEIFYTDAQLNDKLINEICPEMEIEFPEIEVPEINVGELVPSKEPTIEYYNKEPEIKTPTIASNFFDCSSKKTTLSDRLKLKYNNKNAKYKSSKEEITLTHSFTNLDIGISESYFKNKNNFLQTEDFAASCLLIPVDIPELKEENRYLIGDNGTIVNGDVISTINILSKDRIELCINRPVTTLDDSERNIQNYYLDEKKKKKIFTIKQKRKWWFDKKIAEFTISLNANIEPSGCIDKIIAPTDTIEFIPNTAPAGTCYNPHGTTITGLTGKENFSKYGFDRLNFNYEKEIAHNTYDYGETYPDQDQLKNVLFLKGQLLEKGQTITLDGMTFTKSENNTISSNNKTYLNNKVMNTQENNLFTSEFNYSPNPEENYNTVISSVNNIPEEISKFIILDVIIDDRQDDVLQKVLTMEEIKARIKEISGNSYVSYYPEKEETDTTNYYGYQITLYSLLKNQEQFRQYLKSNPKDSDFKKSNIVFLKQIIENTDVYYGDSVTPVLINTKTYGSLETGLTQEILGSVSFMSDIDKQIKLATDSKIKQIETPGLYIFDLNLVANDIIYKVSEADIETKKIFDYYNLPENVAYKENALFTNPINAMYYDYGNIPFRLHDGRYREIKNATVYKDYSDWSKIQDGHLVSFKFNYKKLDDIIFKNIRPIQINAPSGYAYRYLTKDGRYSNLSNKANIDKDTLFVFLENAAKDPQLVITSSSPLAFNFPLSATKSDDGTYTYNIPNSIKSENQQDDLDNYDLFSGTETNNLGYTMDLVATDRTCFNITDDSINFWLNPEYTNKKE